MEFDRLKISHEVLSKSDTTLTEVDNELHANTDGQLLSHLVGEVSEVGLDEAMFGSAFDLKASNMKSKSSFTKKICSPNKNAISCQNPHNCFQMNAIFANSRGLRDLAKHLHIADCI
jgi:hypothetical protein